MPSVGASLALQGALISKGVTEYLCLPCCKNRGRIFLADFRSFVIKLDAYLAVTDKIVKP